MDIGVIGAGNVGAGLAKMWVGAGHRVVLSFARDEANLRKRAEQIGARHGSPRDAATFGSAIVFAPPFSAIEQGLAQAGPLDGKVVIDCTNDVQKKSKGSVAESIAARSGARVVKAFNTMFASMYDAVKAADKDPHLIYCGDDAAAKQLAAELIRDAGFDPIDAGELAVAADLEAFARVVIGICYKQGFGPFAYRFLSSEELSRD